MKTLVFWALVCLSQMVFGQEITGIVKSSKGEVLSYASVYIKGTSTGTSTNEAGQFSLTVAPGTYTIIAQYLGYKAGNKTLTITKPTEINFTLEPEDLSISEVVVKADGEDPAYAIIRQAIKNREANQKLLTEYSCDAYIKGAHKMLSLPDKILGKKLDSIDRALKTDSGEVIYLAESISKVNYKDGDITEEMIASKVSGEDKGFAMNRAILFIRTSLYKNSFNLFGGNYLISPIADNALTHYKYELLGSFLDDNGKWIKRIKVIRKSKTGPSFSGTINIVDETFNIHSADLKATNSAHQVPLIGPINLKYMYVHNNNKWTLLNEYFACDINVIGIKLKATFNGLFTNYNFSPTQINKNKNEVFKVSDSTNLRAINYFDKIRQIPLTPEEKIDYTEKDSALAVSKTDSFKIRQAKLANKFKLKSFLLSGYTHKNIIKNSEYRIGSPLYTFLFNTVQGAVIGTNFTYTKFLNHDNKLASNNFIAKAAYGFADKQIRGSVEFNRIDKGKTFSELRIGAGYEAVNFNENNHIPHNTFYSLLYKRNFAKLYNKAYAKAFYTQEFTNGLYPYIKAETGFRTAAQNNTDYSIYYKNRQYTSNNPINSTNDSLFFKSHSYGKVSVGAFYVINQKYSSYPNRKIRQSFFPKIGANVTVGYANAFYTLLEASFTHKADFNRYGSFMINASAGIFINKPSYFIDYKHFNGNKQGILSANWDNKFFNLPYFQYSTNNSYIQAHSEYNLKGLIFSKLPLLKKLQAKEIISYKLLLTKENKPYHEFAFGLDNLGYSIFKLFRLDASVGIDGLKPKYYGLTLSTKLFSEPNNSISAEF